MSEDKPLERNDSSLLPTSRPVCAGSRNLASSLDPVEKPRYVGWEEGRAVTLEQWLDYLEHRYKREIRLGLVNVARVAKLLEVVTWSIPVITVAGTNGKGSTVAALSAIYQAAGYQFGQFTSPHLLRFNERICINQQPIPDERLCQLFAKIEAVRGDTDLTFFEMSFLAALLYFKDANLDLLILEVGLGGRLDATNVIDPDLAVITTIDLDHQDYLGSDRESIGREKAGIMRTQRPCIYADGSPPKSVLSHAQSLAVDLYCLGVDYHYQVVGDTLHIQQSFQDPIVLPLPSLHHHAAVAAVIASLCLRARLPIPAQAWAEAMQTVRIAGRQQRVSGTISFLYDVAHNPQAALALARCLQQQAPSGMVHAVFSALKDKDICGLIKPLRSIVGQWYPACLQGKRAATQAQLLTSFADGLGLQPQCYADPIQATQAAITAAKPGDLIVIYGSFLMVSAVMQAEFHL